MVAGRIVGARGARVGGLAGLTRRRRVRGGRVGMMGARGVEGLGRRGVVVFASSSIGMMGVRGWRLDWADIMVSVRSRRIASWDAWAPADGDLIGLT